MFTDENERSFDAGKVTQLSQSHHLSINHKTLKCVRRAAAFDAVSTWITVIRSDTTDTVSTN